MENLYVTQKMVKRVKAWERGEDEARRERLKARHESRGASKAEQSRAERSESESESEAESANERTKRTREAGLLK